MILLPSLCLLWGQLNNWAWVEFSKSGEKKFCNVSPDVLFNIFNKINSNLAYCDISHNIEILHLNDSNEFEKEINKQLEKKIEPIEPTFETLNLGNDENPHLIKIGSTLNEKERKYFKELRHMKTEWLLKIKEEVTMQLKVGMCVDFRYLNKAYPKDDFPLPHIDVLVDNIAGSVLLSFMDGFLGYNQIKIAPRDMTKTIFTTERGIYCYTVMSFELKNGHNLIT